MPRYDFVCQDCGTSFELRLSMSAYDAGEGRACPGCGSEQTERSFSAVNVIAGSGGGGPSRTASSNGGNCGFGGFT